MDRLSEFVALIDKAWKDPCPGNIERLAGALTNAGTMLGALANCEEFSRFLAAHKAEVRYWEDTRYNPTRYAPS